MAPIKTHFWDNELWPRQLSLLTTLCWLGLRLRLLETTFDNVVVVPFHREKFSFISSVLRDKGLTKWEGWKGELGFSLRLHEASLNMDGGCLRPETRIDRLTVHWSPCQTFFRQIKVFGYLDVEHKTEIMLSTHPSSASEEILSSVYLNKWMSSLWPVDFSSLVVCVANAGPLVSFTHREFGSFQRQPRLQLCIQ